MRGILIFCLVALALLKSASCVAHEIKFSRSGADIGSVWVRDSTVNYIYQTMLVKFSLKHERPIVVLSRTLNRSVFDSIDAASPLNPNEAVPDAMESVTTFLRWAEKYENWNPPLQYKDDDGRLKEYNWTSGDFEFIPKSPFKLLPLIRIALYCKLPGLMNILESALDCETYRYVAKIMTLRFLMWADEAEELPETGSLLRYFASGMASAIRDLYYN